MPTILQKFDYDLSVWRPTIKRITDSPLWAGVTQGDGRSIVSIPVTSEAISRTTGKAAYLQIPFREPVYEIFGNFGEDFSQETNQYVSDQKRSRIINFISSKNYSVGDLVSFCDLESEHANFSIRSLWNHLAERKDYGIFGKTVTSDEPYFLKNFEMPVNGPQKNVAIQDAWFISGTTGSPDFTPIGKCWIYTHYESEYSGVIETKLKAEIQSPILNRIFPTAVVIESDYHKDALLFVGGFSTYPNLISSESYVFDVGLGSLFFKTTPYPVAKAAAVFIKKHGVALVTGGATTSGTFSTNLGCIYNTATDTWASMTGTLITARRDHQMIRLNDEDVLIIGGRTGIMDVSGHPDIEPMGAIINKCEIVTIDGTVNSAPPKSTGSMSFARTAFGMTKLPGGKILVVGGIGYNPSYPYAPDATFDEELSREFLGELRSCEIYDPTTELWSPIPPMLKRHSYCTCAYIEKQNKVYVYGGFSFDSTLEDTIVEYLDLDTMTWHKSSVNIPKVIACASPGKVCKSLILLPGGGEISSMSSPLTYTISGYNGLWASTRNGGISSYETGPECKKVDGINGYEFKVIKSEPGDPGKYNIYAESTYLGKNDNGAESVCAMKNLRDEDYTSESCGATSTSWIKGPFSYDLTQPFGIGDSVTLNQEIHEGFTYNTIDIIGDSSPLKDGGFIIISYGHENQTGPIRIFGVQDGTKIMIDAGYKFTKNIETGATIFFVTQLGAYQADQSKLLGSFWLTASNAAKQSAVDTIKSISAAGIPLDIIVRYPGDRGLGNEGFPISGDTKLSEIVSVYGNDDLDGEMALKRKDAFIKNTSNYEKKNTQENEENAGYGLNYGDNYGGG